MSDRVFIDTNVLVYCYTSSEPTKQKMAVTVAESTDAYVSTQVLQELANVLYKRFGKSWDEIEGVLEEVCQNFVVVANQPETVQHAVRIARRYHFAFYDSLILAAALNADCKTVFSEDMKDGQIIEGTLKIENPFKDNP